MSLLIPTLFTGLGFDQEIPHHSTFSKNRHGRFQQSKVFQELFERIVEQCMVVGLVRVSRCRLMATLEFVLLVYIATLAHATKCCREGQ